MEKEILELLKKKAIFDKYSGFVIIDETNFEEIAEELNDLFALSGVSNSANGIIKYIEKDAEIAIPIDRLFNDNGEHLTKKEYGHVLIDILCKELRKHFC